MAGASGGGGGESKTGPPADPRSKGADDPNVGGGGTTALALRAGTLSKAAQLGALLGLVAYGTYDLSNYATLDFWQLPMTVVDIVWGAVLSCIAASAGYLAARR